MNRIGAVTLVVRDYDEAISFYTKALGFRVIADQSDEGKRWVMIAPPGDNQCALVLGKAATPDQELAIGNQTGGRVFMFLHTDDFYRDYKAMKAFGVQFLEEPRTEAYGIVAVFKDLYGNKWDLLQHSTSTN